MSGLYAPPNTGTGPGQIPVMDSSAALSLGGAIGAKLLVYGGLTANADYVAGFGTDIGETNNCLGSFIGSGGGAFWSWTVGAGAYPYSSYADVGRLDQSGNLTIKGGVTVGATFNPDGTISGGKAAATLDQLPGAAAPVDVTASRAFGVTYTNSGTAPRTVYVTFAGNSLLTASVGPSGSLVNIIQANANNYADATMTFDVPPGEQYEVTSNGGGTPTLWTEG